jgi:hypothetical protein
VRARENRVPKKEKVTEGWKKLHNELSSSDVTIMEEEEVGRGEMIKSILTLGRKRQLGRRRCGRKDNVELDIKEIGCILD